MSSVCVICGQIRDDDALTKMPSGESVCLGCVEDHPEVLEADRAVAGGGTAESTVCVVCGQAGDSSERTETTNENVVCYSCLERHSDIEEADAADPDCFVCEEIGYPETRASLTVTPDDEPVCLDCAEEYPKVMDPEKREAVSFETIPAPSSSSPSQSPAGGQKPSICERCGFNGSTKRTRSGRLLCHRCRKEEKKRMSTGGVVTDPDPFSNEQPYEQDPYR
jgi:hypothetical protein